MIPRGALSLGNAFLIVAMQLFPVMPTANDPRTQGNFRVLEVPSDSACSEKGFRALKRADQWYKEGHGTQEHLVRAHNNEGHNAAKGQPRKHMLHCFGLSNGIVWNCWGQLFYMRNHGIRKWSTQHSCCLHGRRHMVRVDCYTLQANYNKHDTNSLGCENLGMLQSSSSPLSSSPSASAPVCFRERVHV